MAISARNIVTMTVTYVRKPVLAVPVPESQPAANPGPEQFAAAAGPEPTDDGTR